MDFFAIVEAEAEKLVAAAEEKGEEAVAFLKTSIVPYAEGVFESFVTKYAPLAAQLVVQAATGELSAALGGQKQSWVVTQLSETAQADAHEIGSDVLSASQTLAQMAVSGFKNILSV